MKHRVRWIALTAGVVVAVLAVVFATQISADPREDATRSHLVGTRAPDIDLPTLEGSRVSSANLAGKVVIVNFWNSWCTPCREEHPALVKFYENHATDPGFAMIGIVRSDTEEAIRNYVQDEGVPYTVAFDPGGRAAFDYGSRGQPETYAISPDGVIEASNWGRASVALLEQMYRTAKGGP